MPSLSELRRKVRSIKSTQQITKAMKMIAGARLARAQRRLTDARYFSDNILRLISEVTRILESRGEYEPSAENKSQLLHPLLRRRNSDGICLVIVSADKGLCGAFNTNIIRKGMEFIRGNPGKKINLFVVGRKVQDYFRR